VHPVSTELFSWGPIITWQSVEGDDLCASSPRVGHANFPIVEEILPGEEVLGGTFYLFEYPIIILFNSGASMTS
jgi:hypothetical protein